MKNKITLRPSGWGWWSNCPGGPNFVSHLDIVETSSYSAEEGSAAHALDELCLKESKPPKNYIGRVIYGDFKVTEEMAEAVEVYTSYIWKLIESYDPDFYDVKLGIEVFADLDFCKIKELTGGTSDCVIVVIDKLFNEVVEIYIIDYKHGAGVFVDVEKNGQLLQYALGQVFELLGRKLISRESDIPVSLVVVQPRIENHKGPIRTYQTSTTELFNWKDELIKKAKAALDPNAPLIPGESQCRFCPAKSVCPALYKKTQELAIIDFQGIDELPAPKELTDEQIIGVLDYSDVIKDFIKAVHIEAQHRFEIGNEKYQQNFKLVESITRRQLNENALDTLEFYGDNELFMSHKIKGLGDIEKELKKLNYTKSEIKAIMQEVTTKPESQIVIAPISDSRKAVESSAMIDFKDCVDDA